jgi:ubiquinone/menaquinone biosynthesis C-methylase UbiE
MKTARIAVVGGGPGGLFTSYLLNEFCGDLCQVTLFEAGTRLGGKVVTTQFVTAPVIYEAGVAELYDYSRTGPDPLKRLVQKMGLTAVPMDGQTVIMRDAILKTSRDIRRHFGEETLHAIRSFQQRCRDMCSPAEYYEGHPHDDNRHPWANKTFADVLDEIPDENARKYIAVAARSDLATEPGLTSALNGLKNVLMDDAHYLRLYSIEGGIELLIDGLKQRINADVRLQSPVVSISRDPDGTYRLGARCKGIDEDHTFDMVVLALPNYWLQRMDWGSRELRQAMEKHLVRYDRPAHYLRMSLLFREPFWRSCVTGSFFMMDAFGGCCVYDEGTRHPCDPYGVLGWLLGGNDALALSNHSDGDLVALALDSLPAPLAHGRDLLLEGRVHRWTGTINALPGGNPVAQTRERHVPDPLRSSGLYVVGDYLFDSTLNGVLDSADFVTDLILTELRKQKYAVPAVNGHVASAVQEQCLGPLDAGYHDQYDGTSSYEDSFEEYFCEQYTIDLIRAVWGWSPPYTLLDCGSASGQTLEAFARVGVEAWGVENSPHIHSRTPRKWKNRNLLGDVRKLPFPDNSFDFVYDTCLCYLPEGDLGQAIAELFRVCRVGVYYAGVATDMTCEVIETHDLFDEVRSFLTLWEWSEAFLSQGFRLAVTDPKVVARAWRIEVKSNEGDFPWYPDGETMRHCFFSKPGAPPPVDRSGRPTGRRRSASRSSDPGR